MRDLSSVSLSFWEEVASSDAQRDLQEKGGAEREQWAAPGTWKGLGWELQLHPKNGEDSAALDTNPEQEEFTLYSSLT